LLQRCAQIGRDLTTSRILGTPSGRRTFGSRFLSFRHFGFGGNRLARSGRSSLRFQCQEEIVDQPRAGVLPRQVDTVTWPSSPRPRHLRCHAGERPACEVPDGSPLFEQEALCPGLHVQDQRSQVRILWGTLKPLLADRDRRQPKRLECPEKDSRTEGRSRSRTPKRPRASGDLGPTRPKPAGWTLVGRAHRREWSHFDPKGRSNRDEMGASAPKLNMKIA